MNESSAAMAAVDGLPRRPQEQAFLVASQRVSMVVLLGLVLWSANRSLPFVWFLLMFYGLAATFNQWRVTTGRGESFASLPFYWTSAALVLAIARGTAGGELLLVLFLYPLTMCTLLHGVRHALALGAVSAALWVLDLSRWGMEPTHALPALAFLLLPVITSVISYPMAALRQRNLLVADLDQHLDPRRGLVAVGLELGERLRKSTHARRVLICHRDAERPTVLVCDADEGAYAASGVLGDRVLAMLGHLHPVPLAWDVRDTPRADRSTKGQTWADESPPGALLKDLAQLLEADHLHLVPDAPGKASTGWMLVVYGPDAGWRQRSWPLPHLAGFAADMRRLLQQASYLDRLQEEIAAHERSRIGRDMHDSAIQPYLGLKFAIEGLALRSEPENRLHTQIQELRGVCDAELVELRRTVSALRAGDHTGENSLAAALQRQCSRFARLFEIQVDLQVPAELPASRTLVSALLHMVNEGLNNVRRHTQAQRVWIHLSDVPGALQLVIRDDAGKQSGKAAPDFEPRSLTERARELGGVLELRRPNGLDTEIHITVPT